MVNKKLIIVSGATGDLGKAYLEHYKNQLDVYCYGLSRRKEETPLNNVTYLMSDLENEQTTKNQINSIEFQDISKIIYVHPVGKFKFEEKGVPEIDYNNDSIDDEVYQSNINTFHNVVKPLILKRNKDTPLTLVAFGSLSDFYTVPWWGSYSKSKLILRKDLRELSRLEDKVNSIFINLSSVRTSNEFKTRPYADTKYWISPSEIVTKTRDIIEKSTQKYLEIDVYNESPEYHRDYYNHYEELKEKWKKEMFGK
jgi:NADP-dependent 3-hydroxy acid dehydrogenase YdfG